MLKYRCWNEEHQNSGKQTCTEEENPPRMQQQSQKPSPAFF